MQPHLILFFSLIFRVLQIRQATLLLLLLSLLRSRSRLCVLRDRHCSQIFNIFHFYYSSLPIENKSVDIYFYFIANCQMQRNRERKIDCGIVGERRQGCASVHG